MKHAILSALMFCVAMSCHKGPKKPEPPLPDNPHVDTFPEPAVSPPVPENWAQAQQQRAQARQDHIEQHWTAYDWFANFPFSERDGVPYLMLRLMPVIAPEIWGSEDNFLDVVGLFKDDRMSGYPLPRGVGFSGLSRDDPNGNIDYASFTCGACHIGRVKRSDGSFDYLDGGINTEFNIVLYRIKVFQTLEKIYDGHTGKLEKDERATRAFIEALDTMHLQDKNFFYRDYTHGDRHFDAAYEAEQVKLFKHKAITAIPFFLLRAELEFDAYKALVEKNYQGYEAQMLAGLGGMVDATGVNTGNVYIIDRLLDRKNPSKALPPTPGLTDIMAVWEQDKRKGHWNADKTQIIKGGGQWNGNIPIPVYRNLIAALTLGLLYTDVRVAAFGEELLEGLPAAAYPFDVDVTLANRGRALYQDNCVDCHRPHNGTTYTQMGTDMNRAFVVDAPTASSARSLLLRECSPKTKVDMGQGDVYPCAEFAGVSMEGRGEASMSPVNEHWGYNALPLGGIWAQAPYLHTGSIPTLYHLLVVAERPDTFIKGRLEYDQEKVGYSWAADQDTAAGSPNLTYVYDTNAFKVLTKKGHDTDITLDGKTYKLDWSGDVDGAKAIIEYMKTL